MRRIYSLFALCALFLFIITSHAYATDYTIEPKADGAEAVKSRAIPLRYDAGNTWGSVSQQIYLASELIGEGAGAGNIDAISFYYGAITSAVSALSRPIQIFMMQVPAEKDSFVVETVPHNAYTNDYLSKFLYVSSTNKSAGARVYNGALITEAVNTSDIKKVKIDFDDSFSWDGESNIVLTIFDMSSTANTVSATNYSNLRFLISKTDHPRFLCKKWIADDIDNRATWIEDMSNNLVGRYGETWSTNSLSGQVSKRSYVNKVDFSISPAAVVIPAPTNLAASSITTSSSTLSWDAAAGATGYNVRWGKTSGSLDHSQNNVAGTSLPINDLDDGETYYFDVQTITAGGTSVWASEASFNTTAIIHIHDGISFSKWASTTTMPTSGNYYLNDDVAFDIESSDVTLTGNLNLCLNGHTADLYGSKIIVPYGKTLSIYDNVGGGKITGFVASEVGAADIYAKALIVVYAGGELDLYQGTIENNYEHDPEDPLDTYYSYAIYSNGTLHLSGDVLINSNNTDIYLYSSNVIILDGAISNAEKHTVYKMGGDITYGWSTYMSSADPRDYFESANSARSVCLNEGEASLRLLLTLSESSLNSSIGTSYNQLADVDLTRSLTSSQYNTFCLPFALSNAQLEEVFGASYDLRQLESSSFDGEMLNLVFSDPLNALEAGKPYLIQPSQNVVNPSFEGVTITATSPINVVTSYVDFKGIYAPTELTKDNKNQLFLDAGNELKYPVATANLKGFRAYFELKGDAAVSLSPVRARIVLHEDAATGLEQTSQEPRANSQKLIKEGQLIIERNGTLYNAQGQVIK